MDNHKVMNDKSNETGIDNCNCGIKNIWPLPRGCQTKYIIYQANIDCDIAELINQSINQSINVFEGKI